MGSDLRAVVALINLDGMILMGKKRVDGGGLMSGKWHVPGETLEMGETDEDALKRGMMEEAGIKVKVIRYLSSHRTPKHTLVRWYECETETSEVRPGSDLEDVGWVPRKEVPALCGDRVYNLWSQHIRDYFDIKE